MYHCGDDVASLTFYESQQWCILVCCNLNSTFAIHRATRLATFPDYLMVQLKKFTIGDDWVPRKLGNETTIYKPIISKTVDLHSKNAFNVFLPSTDRMP